MNRTCLSVTGTRRRVVPVQSRPGAHRRFWLLEPRSLFFWIVEEGRIVPIMGVNTHVDWPPLGRPQVDYFEAPGDSQDCCSWPRRTFTSVGSS